MKWIRRLEKIKEVESSFNSTSFKTTQDGTTRTCIVGRTKRTSQNIIIMSTKKDTTNISEIYHLEGA